MLDLLAQVPDPIDNQFLAPDLTALSGQQFVGNVLSGLVTAGLIIGAVVFVFMFIQGGIMWTSSGGDKGRAEAARGKVTAALVGLVILFSIYAIINIVSCFFGINFIQLQFGPLNVTTVGSPLCR